MCHPSSQPMPMINLLFKVIFIAETRNGTRSYLITICRKSYSTHWSWQIKFSCPSLVRYYLRRPLLKYGWLCERGDVLIRRLSLTCRLHGRKRSTKEVKVQINYVLKAVRRNLREVGRALSSVLVWGHTGPFLKHFQWVLICLLFSLDFQQML